MDKYNKIVKALEELKRTALLDIQCYVKFRIEPRNDYHFYDPTLFSAIMVNAKKAGDGLILQDMTLAVSLFLDGNHEEVSKELFEKLNKTKLKEYFPDFPESFAYGPFYANAGNDIRIIASLVLLFIYSLSKCREFEIIPKFNAFFELEQKESLD